MSPEITAADVKALRERTGAAMMDCKSALSEAGGDMEKAIELLRVKGQASAAKRSGRSTGEGVVSSYVHATGKIGVLVEVRCETDFVARNDEFRAFVKDLCLHIAAASPLYVSRDQVPEADLAAERDIAAAQVAGKPPAAIQKIVEGKLEKFYSSIVLLDQPFVKIPEKTVKELITEKIAKTGENLQIRRFVRYQLGA